jgi:hypothetical protein
MSSAPGLQGDQENSTSQRKMSRSDVGRVSLADMTDTETPKTAGRGLLLGVIAVVVLAVAVGAFLLLGDDDDDGGAGGAKTLSVEELQDLAAERDRPTFWAGPQSGLQYEVTETGDGAVYIRYLPEDAEVGDPRPGYLTVATYPLDNGYDRVAAASRRDDTEAERLDDGGLAVINETRPSSVYLAHRDGKYQVEVYHPSPERARELVVSGAVQPVR